MHMTDYGFTLPPLSDDANKYSRGKLTVVAGSARYPGAAVLAARASQRMGAGYTEVVTDGRAVDIVRLSSPSLVVCAFGEWRETALPAMRSGKPCAVCVGPGFVPGDDEAAALVIRALKAPCPVVVDGGALSCLGSKKARKRLAERAEAGWATVVTPHGGEAARLAEAFEIAETAAPASSPRGPSASSASTALAPAAVQAELLARALPAIVVLKGPDTYISDGTRTCAMTEGTPALAKAGTGDVLAGMLGSLLAQGTDPFEAALAAPLLHARAAAAAAERLSDRSVCAEDVIDSLR